MAKLTYYLNVTGYSSYINSSILSKSLGTTYLGGTSSNVLALNRSYIPSVSFTKYAGIDVPTLIKDTTKNNTDVIVFVGESPTRDSWHYPANGKGKVGQDIIVGAPFGVNWAKNTKDGLDIYTEIFDHCLSHNRNYDVYVTDVNKLWTDQMEFKTPQLVSSPTMLANEINNILGLYQNVYIVCFGNESDDFFNKNMGSNSLGPILQKVSLRIKILHPSKTNWPNWQAYKAKEIISQISKNPVNAQQLANGYLKDVDKRGRDKAIPKWAIEDMRAKGIPRI